MSAQITFATAEDAPAIAKLYAPFVENTAVSFETIPPSADEMAKRIENPKRSRGLDGLSSALVK